MKTAPSDAPLFLHLFDPEQAVSVVERRLPHWAQPGALAFITWRTRDSMSRQVLDRWCAERNEWLRANGIAAEDRNWQKRLQHLDPQHVRRFLNQLWNRWHDALDACHGACMLRRSDLADVLAKSLLCFNGQRYLMVDFVIMPNHVHLLASFPDDQAMLAQCESWKHFTAKEINLRLGKKGRFWQSDAFDHLVRSEEQMEYLRRYIAENPRKAGLRSGEFRHYSQEASCGA